MTADTVDLEDCDNAFRGLVGSFADENMDVVNSFLNPPFRKLPPASPLFQTKYGDSLYDIPDCLFPIQDVGNIAPIYDQTQKLAPIYDQTQKFSDWDHLPMPFDSYEYLLPPEEDATAYQSYDDAVTSSYITPTFENSSHSDMESDLQLVSPDSILPNPQKEEDIEQLELMWPELGDLSDEKLDSIVKKEFSNSITIEDILMKKKRRKLTHLDIDHSYAVTLRDEYYEEDYYFNSSPCSPASSSCSDQFDSTRGVKRSRPKRKNVRRKKIKQEVLSSDEDEEVDVETPCSVPLVVPKITISISSSPTVNRPPAKRGRKPKNKTEGQIVKKPNKNYPVPPKVLQAAIQQQKKKLYITKSGRVTNKISNSVETTPSTSAPSSISNSRSNSDNEDNVDKRASHNMAERNRRQELTNLFQNLRENVNDIKNNSKASKVAILQGAAREVQTLEGSIELKERQLKQLRAEMQRKIALVQSLKNNRGYSS